MKNIKHKSAYACGLWARCVLFFILFVASASFARGIIGIIVMSGRRGIGKINEKKDAEGLRF